MLYCYPRGHSDPAMTVIDANALRTDALAAQARGDITTAHTLFERLLAAVPDDFVALYYLAAMEANAGRHSAALPFIEQAIAVGPGVAQAHRAHAVIAYNLGR